MVTSRRHKPITGEKPKSPRAVFVYSNTCLFFFCCDFSLLRCVAFSRPSYFSVPQYCLAVLCDQFSLSRNFLTGAMVAEQYIWTIWLIVLELTGIQHDVGKSDNSIYCYIVRTTWLESSMRCGWFLKIFIFYLMLYVFTETPTSMMKRWAVCFARLPLSCETNLQSWWWSP